MNAAGMEIWETISGALDRFYEVLWPMAVCLAGVGIATMAVLEILKDLFKLHRRFNEKQIKDWLDKRAERALKKNLSCQAESARTSLLTLAVSGEEDALYSLDTERMLGQISAASQIVLDFPSQHRDLFVLLAAEADSEDLERLLSKAPPGADATDDDAARKAREEFVDARNRVSHQVQRSLDALQINLAYRWKRQNQARSFLLNFIFVLAALCFNSFMADFEIERFRKTLPIYISVAVFGAFMAPLAKDLVTALQQLRTRPR